MKFNILYLSLFVYPPFHHLQLQRGKETSIFDWIIQILRLQLLLSLILLLLLPQIAVVSSVHQINAFALHSLDFPKRRKVGGRIRMIPMSPTTKSKVLSSITATTNEMTNGDDATTTNNNSNAAVFDCLDVQVMMSFVVVSIWWFDMRLSWSWMKLLQLQSLTTALVLFFCLFSIPNHTHTLTHTRVNRRYCI